MAGNVTILRAVQTASGEAEQPSDVAETVADLVERGWITIDDGRACVTAEGEAALLAFYNRTCQELMPGGYVVGWAEP
jgi:hypothetical protein